MKTPDEAEHWLAVLLSKRRVGSSVFMDGSHNPTPGEIQEARYFIRDLIDAGWQPPEVKDEPVL